MTTNAQAALLAATTYLASGLDDQTVSAADVRAVAEDFAQWLDDRDQFGPKKVERGFPTHVAEVGDLLAAAWDERTQLPEGTAPNHARRFNLLNNHRTCPLDGTAVTVETTTGHLICTAIPHHDWMPDATLVARPPKEMPLCMGCGGLPQSPA